MTETTELSPEMAHNMTNWDGPNDPENPINWPTPVKLRLTSGSCMIVFVISFASSVFAPAVGVTAHEYGVSELVMSLGVSLYVVGFAVGPCFFAPLSEIVGHFIPLMIGITGCSVFQLPMALATNPSTILISRFLAGVIGSACLAVGSGMFTGVYEPISRGIAVGLSATCMNLGSSVAPIVGSYLTENLGWRWTGWGTLIFGSVVAVFGALVLRETSPRLILSKKAKRLGETRGAAGKFAIDAFAELAQKYLTKPVKMFWHEPILIIITVYLTFTYGTLYLSYQLVPFTFKQRGWSAEKASLPFVAVSLGIIGSWLVWSSFLRTWYKTQGLKRAWVAEDRLPPMILGGVILPPALLWFGWTTHLHWISQVLACFFIGMSLVLLFISGVVYMVDIYGADANSAISIHVVIRSIFAATFPLWSPPMYQKFQVQWSSTLLASFSACLMPFPILFFVYGSRIRKRSKYSSPMG